MMSSCRDYRQNILARAEAHAASDAIALVSAEGRLSYVGLMSEARSIADQLDQRGVVLFVADNTVASVIAYCAFLLKGIVPLMVSKKQKTQELGNLIDAYKPLYIWVSCARKQEFCGYSRLHRCLDHELLKAREQTDAKLHDDLALLLPTSGSTGSSKYVRLTLRNVVENALSIIAYLHIDGGERAITTLPMSYSYGLSIINSHLLAGASLVLTDESLTSRGFWDLLENSNVTSFGGVPYTYSMLKRIGFDPGKYSSLRYITQAGGRLSENLQEHFASLCGACGKGFIVMYGQTEATARLSYLPGEKALEKIGSIGIAIPGGRFEIVNIQSGEECLSYENGELVFYGPNVSMGYARGFEDLSLGDENSGRLATGDIAYMDDEGFLFIVGRKKRFVKLFGNRINLDDCDASLKEMGFEAACVGDDDGLYVFVEGENGAEAKKALASKLSIHSSAINIREVVAIPRNESGKVLFSELEKLC